MAFKHAAHVCWMLPTKANDGLSPWEVATGTKPDLDRVRAFGCTAYPYLRLSERQKIHNSTVSPKLLPACEVGIYVGQAPRSKGFLLWFPKRQKCLVRRNVLFDERAVCDAHGKIAGVITGNDSGKVPNAKRDMYDPHITDAHREFVGTVFHRTKETFDGEQVEEIGIISFPVRGDIVSSLSVFLFVRNKN